MDDDSCSKFIGSLTKYLQSLCHSYVDFDTGVELVGHIYLNVDTGKKIDYVLNESVCKNGANVVKFTSNSYHAQPVEKQKKETPKKAPDPPKSTSEPRKKNDDDDVIIVGSEGSRRNRAGSSPSRSHASPNQMQRGMVAGQNRMGQAQGGVFRYPRGPNPRMGGPVPRAGGYTYQPRQRLTYPQQPRNFINTGAGYSPRMRQPHYPQPRGAQPHAVRGANPIDTDVTFMREEYVAGQPISRAVTQPGQTGPVVAGAQQPGYPYQARQAAPLQMQQTPHMQQPHMQQQQHYMAPYGQDTTATAGQPTSIATTVTSGPALVPGQEGSAGVPLPGTVPSTTIPSFFDQSQPPVSSVSGGMPLPVTTHTIFDSGPVMSSTDVLSSQQQTGDAINTTAASAIPSGTDPLVTAMSSAEMSSSISSGVPGTSVAPMEAQPGLLIGQVWSESAAAPAPSTVPGTQAQPASGSSLPYPSSAAPGISTTPVTSLQSTNSVNSSGQSGNVFNAFNQQLPAQAQTSQPPPATPFSPTVSQGSTVSQSNPAAGGGAGGDGDGFSALVSELQALNQAPGNQPMPPTPQPLPTAPPPGNTTHPQNMNTHPPSPSHAGLNYPGNTAAAAAEGSVNSVSALPAPVIGLGGLGVKKDPGDIGVNVATSVLQESTEAAVNEAPETFLAPLGMGGPQGGLESYRKRSGSASSQSRGTPSPSSASLVGPESVVIETKPFLHHASDYDSGCDSASTSTGERLASPQQGAPPTTSHSQFRSLSIPLVPVDSPTSSTKSLDIKRERVTEEDAELERAKSAESQWAKTPGSDWITDMSAINNSDDSMDSASDGNAQDDDDPSYTPGRPINSEKGSVKRSRTRQTDKGNRGKKRKLDTADSEGTAEEQRSTNSDVTAETEVPRLLDLPPPLDSDQQQEGAEGDGAYKPGTFILVNMSKDSERSGRMRPVHTPAEVIATPPGQLDGVWVHILVIAGNGLWRLPSIDQMTDVRVDPADIVKTLEHANVKISGNKVFYKFDDMRKRKRTVGSTVRNKEKKSGM